MGPANTPSSTSLFNTSLLLRRASSSTSHRLPPLSLPRLQIGPTPGQTTTTTSRSSSLSSSSSTTRVLQEELYLRQRVISILTQALDIVEDRD